MSLSQLICIQVEPVNMISSLQGRRLPAGLLSHEPFTCFFSLAAGKENGEIGKHEKTSRHWCCVEQRGPMTRNVDHCRAERGSADSIASMDLDSGKS